MFFMQSAQGSGDPPPSLSAVSLSPFCPFPFRQQLLLYDYESLADFVQQRLKLNRQNNFLRVDDDISPSSRPRPRQPHGFAQTALHAVALNRSPQGASHGESHAQPRSGDRRLSPQVKDRDRRRKVATTQLVHPLKIPMPQEPPGPWEFS